MNVSDTEEDRPLAWNAILANTPVYSSDGSDLGPVQEVLGAEDIFHGIVVGGSSTHTEALVPAEKVAAITNRRIDITLTAEEVWRLDPYQPEQSYQLGIIGMFRHRLGWEDDRDRQP
jgi:hypothetical protein